MGQSEQGCGRRESRLSEALKEPGTAGTWGARGECAARPRGREMEEPDLQENIGRPLNSSEKALKDFEQSGGLMLAGCGDTQLWPSQDLSAGVQLLVWVILLQGLPCEAVRLPGVLALAQVSSRGCSLFRLHLPSPMMRVLADTLPRPARARTFADPELC